MAKSARRNQKKNRSSKRRRVVKGGSGAADWAISAFGGVGQQHAQPGSNLIAVRDASIPVVVAGQAGGMVTLTPAQLGGMGHLSPAVLKGGKKGGALFALSPMALSDNVSNVVKGGSITDVNSIEEVPQDVMDALVLATEDEDEAAKSTSVEYLRIDGKLYKAAVPVEAPADPAPVVPVEEAQDGGSLLNDIAVPAVLLLGNRMFRGKRGSAKRNAKRNPKRTSSRRARR